MLKVIVVVVAASTAAVAVAAVRDKVNKMREGSAKVLQKAAKTEEGRMKVKGKGK